MPNIEWDIPFDLDPVADSQDLTLEQCLEAGSDGVFISNEKYHQLPGISGTKIPLWQISNKHLDHAELFRLEQTDALIFGNLLHTLVLEPDELDNRYAVLPKFATKAETGLSIVQSNKQFHADNQGKIIIDAADMQKARRMAGNVRAIAGDVIDSGIKERSLFVDLDGIILKCRIDIETPDGNDYDLKSIQLKNMDMSDSALERHIKAHGYQLSAALRNLVRRALGKPVHDSYLIFASKSSGNLVLKKPLAPLWIQESEAIIYDLLEDRRFYLASGIDRKPAVIDDRSRKTDNY